MRHKGYTLIELLIVLALFSLLFSISIPSMGIINRTRERNELRELKRDLLYTRNKAIVDCKSYIMELDYSDNGYRITCIDGNIIKDYSFQYGIRIIRNPDISNFTFSRYGRPSKSGTVSIVDSSNNRYEIAVAPATGKISLKTIK